MDKDKVLYRDLRQCALRIFQEEGLLLVCVEKLILRQLRAQQGASLNRSCARDRKFMPRGMRPWQHESPLSTASGLGPIMPRHVPSCRHEGWAYGFLDSWPRG